MRQHAKIVAVTAVVLLLCVFAGWRVAPYICGRGSTEREQRQQVVRLLNDTKIPEYRASVVDDNVGLRDGLDRKLRAVLESLPERERPTAGEVSAIAARYLDFVTLNLTGTREDLLRDYERRGFVPFPWLVQEDSARADKAWQASVAWARHAPFDTESLRAETVQRRGQRVATPRYDRAPMYSPNTGSGTLYARLSEAGQGRTAYEIQTTHTVPSKDGSTELEVTFCVVIADVGPRGAWDVVATTYTGVPEGTLVSLPYP